MVFLNTRCGNASTTNYYNKQNSTLLPNPPTNTISQLQWSPDGQYLGCASWDKTCRIWNIQESQSSGFGSSAMKEYRAQPLILYTDQAPILANCFGENASMFFTGGCEKVVKAYDVNSGRTQPQVIGNHDSSIFFVAWNPFHKVLMSASWDGYIKMWDGKQQSPVWEQSVGSKLVKGDFNSCFICLCDTFRNNLVLNISVLLSTGVQLPPAHSATNLPGLMRISSHHQKMQSRSVCLFPDDASQRPGMAVGSVEGRCTIFYIKTEHRISDFSFRCHRSQSGDMHDIYSVNAISFNKHFKTLATGGSDGVIGLWDKDSHQKLKTFDPMGNSISDVKYSPTSHTLAYSLSYDWHKGPDPKEMSKPHEVYIHNVKEEDARPRPKSVTRR